MTKAKQHEWDVRYFNSKLLGGISAIVKARLSKLEGEGWEVFSIFTPGEALIGVVVRRTKKRCGTT